MAPLCSRCLLRVRCPEFDADNADRECPLALEAQTTLITEAMRLPHLQPEDFPLVSEWAKQTCFLALVDRYVGEVGFTVADRKKGTLDLTPILTRRYTIAGHVARLSDRLGLNPTARARLKGLARATTSPMAAAFLALEAGGENADNGGET